MREATETLILDAGVGNLGNVERAVRHLGGQARITRDPDTVAGGRSLILPGVGAFRPPREALRGPLEAAIRTALDDGAWLLGICVGYQLLFESGEEFGVTAGLGLLPGVVRRLPDGVPLPHIGWNRLHDERPHALLEGIAAGSFVYFVHSFAPAEVPPELTLAGATHGATFPAIAGRGRVLGTQFHPEKSGGIGLTMLGNFLRLAGARQEPIGDAQRCS